MMVLNRTPMDGDVCGETSTSFTVYEATRWKMREMVPHHRRPAALEMPMIQLFWAVSRLRALVPLARPFLETRKRIRSQCQL